jgi:hypothetical protein
MHLERYSYEGAVSGFYLRRVAGVPLTRTFKVLKSTSESSSLAVHEALNTIRYYPAEIHGKRVHQLVQEEFIF